MSMDILKGKIVGDNLLVTLLTLLGVKYTKSYAKKLFNEHPHKYDLYGLSKMLNLYKIDSVGIKIDNKLKDISNIELPFIAQVAENFVIVEKVTETEVQYIWEGKILISKLTDFIESWSGIALLIQKGEKKIEPEYKKHRIEEIFLKFQKISLIICSVVLLFFCFLSNGAYRSLGVNILLILNIVGLISSYLLVLKKIKVQSSYADKLCSLLKQGDCNSVLESSASTIYGLIGWSDIGLGYFIANILIITLFPSFISYLAIVNILSLPYSVWSIWYQKFKVKQWCVLCITVQFLFWIIFANNLIFDYVKIPEITIEDLLFIASLYIVPVLYTNFISPKLESANKLEDIVQEMNSLKMTSGVFKTLIKQQKYYYIDKNVSKILFGNPNANITITILTNPHCNPCARMHKRIDELLQKVKDEICVQYVFSSFNESLDNSGKFLISAYNQLGADRSTLIFDEWFEKGKYDRKSFFKKYCNIVVDDCSELEYLNHQSWKKSTGLIATPTILINGFELPKDYYKIEDIEYFTKIKL